jgi:hypothetical protein
MAYVLPFDSWWMRGVLLLVGLVLLAVSGAQFYDDWRFAHEGRSARGTVVKKEIRTTTSHRRGTGSSSRTPHYDVSYRFLVGDAIVAGRDELGEDDWKRLREGGPVDVLYLAANASSNRLAASRAGTATVIFGLVGLTLIATGVVVSVRAVRR